MQILYFYFAIYNVLLTLEMYNIACLDYNGLFALLHAAF